MTTLLTPIPSFGGLDFYVPYYEVRLRGNPLDSSVVRDIMKVTYKDSLESIDSFELTINNWDATLKTLKYSDETLFDPGVELELWMGYYGTEYLRRMIVGQITSLRPSFPSGGQPSLAVSGLNLLHQFREKQISDVYENVKDSDIAKRIAGRLDVDIEIKTKDLEDTYEYLVQDNKYDIVFLMERARRVGYDLFVKETNEPTLFFGSSTEEKKPSYRLTYGASNDDTQRRSLGGERIMMNQFSPNLTTANQVSTVTVVAWDTVNKKQIKAEATRAELGQNEPNAVARVSKAFDKKHEVISDKPVGSEAEAKTLALETLRRIAKDMIKGSGSVIGLPDLRAGAVVEIDGLGERFSGRYFVTGTTHSIGSSGYTTQFECRMEEE